MQQLDKTATAIFHKLIEGGSKIIGEGGPFMDVHVEKIGANRWSIAHYFEQNGDLCCDPDMEFTVNGEGIVPAAFQQAIPPVYTIAESDPSQLGSLVEFANQWMRNIADQQELKIGT